MADIFISYSREDREWVARLANAIEAEGFTVWWDWDLLVGKRYRETIEAELQTCKATVVVWSTHSIKSDFVRDEAEEGQQRNILVPLLKESVRPPAGFRQLQTADLATWTGAAEHAEFRRVMRGVSHLIGRQAKGEMDEAPHDPPAPSAVVQPVAAAAPTPIAEPPSPPRVVQAKVPPPPGPPPQVQAMLAAIPHHTNPIWKYIAIGVVALLAVILIASQFIPSSTPTTKPLAGGTPPAQTPSSTTATTPPASGGATTGGTAGGGTGGESGGDVAGNSRGSSSNSTPPPAADTPAPPGESSGSDEGQMK